MKDKTNRLALRVSLTYCVVAAAWILLSDRMLVALVSNPEIIGKIAVLKGLTFVAVTTFLLYLTLQNQLRRWEREAAAHMQLEEALEESKARMQAVMEHLPQKIFIKDRDSRYTFINDNYAKDLGIRPDDATGKSDDEFFPKALAEKYRADDRRIMESGRTEELDEKYLQNGREVWIQTTKVPLRDGSGKIAGVCGIFHDVTERKRNEAALLESEELYHSLFNNMLNGFAYCRMEFDGDSPQDFTYLNVNPAFESLTGLKNVEGRKATEVMPGIREADPELLGRYGRVARTGVPERFETYVESLKMWFSIAVFSPRKGHFVAVFDVITERKRADEKLRESEERYRSVLENALDAIFTISRDGMMQSANPGCEQITGLRPEDWLGRPFGLLLHPDDLAFATEMFQRVLTGEKIPAYELRVRTASEKYVTLEFLCTSQSEDGKIVGLLGFGRDITARKRAEENQSRLATAVEQASETIMITDTHGTILYANPAFEKSTGYTRAEALGQNPRIFNSGKQDAGFYRQMWEVLGRGEVWHGHFINKNKDGRLYEEEANISPIRDTTGRLVNYVAVKRDVTKEMQLEAQFRQSQKMEGIGQLAGGVAHDFNNILAVIQMQADLLRMDENITPAQLETVKEIGGATQRAVALTRQLLLFSRKQTLQLRDLDLNDSINDLTKMLRRTLGENIELQFKFAMRPLPIHADAGMLDQVLMNLAINSRDAMPEGGQLVIKTSAVELDGSSPEQSAGGRPGSFVCLTVSDTGCGIPLENLPRIFEPFFTTKEVGKGTGLGLATVFGIVQQHKGWINVYSEPGRGTTFHIYLPRLEKTSGQKTGQPASAAMRGGNETILLVEDDAFLRASVRKALTQLGYRVLEAVNGIEALDVWNQHRDEIHLLLTDMVMPGGISGLELAGQLLELSPKLKVVYASGYSAEIASKDFPLVEGVNFLNKPFETHKLAQTLRQMLDSTSS